MSHQRQRYIEMNYSEAYDMGYKAFKEGAYRNDNPFNQDDEDLLHEGWLTGFIDAREECY